VEAAEGVCGLVDAVGLEAHEAALQRQAARQALPRACYVEQLQALRKHLADTQSLK
jgi:hypothetical protein